MSAKDNDPNLLLRLLQTHCWVQRLTPTTKLPNVQVVTNVKLLCIMDAENIFEFAINLDTLKH